MAGHPEFNHRALFPALESLPYVIDVMVGETEQGNARIEVEITEDGYGPIFADLTRLANRHQVVRTKPVSTCIGLNKKTNLATLTPA